MAGDRCETAGTAGVLVRGWRAAAGLTQQELATRAGISVGAVRDLEQGRVTRPQTRILERLADALGLGSGQRADLAATAAGTTGRPGRPGTGLWLRVLGPVGCWHGSMPVPLGPARQRAVVALLAVQPNTAVRREAIIDALWPDGPPGSAIVVVQSHVSRLRKILDGDHRTRPGGAVLVSTGTSYRLDVGPDELDLLAFRQLAARARRAAPGDRPAACHQFDRALELWEDEPLADVDVLAGHPAVAGLTTLRASVITEYAQIASEAGMAGQVLPHLRALAEREPLNEHAYAHLMTCLAASGQQARALQIYEDLRQRLDDQLGVRPGPELAGTHLRILRQEIPVKATAPGPRAESPARVAAAASAMVPQQLPAAVSHFTGRGRELAELSRLLEPGHATGGTMVISAIGGAAGVGKTALAVHWAHDVMDRFPDGQLYVNLRGYDPGQPIPAADALARLLRSLGVPGQDIPPEEEECAARYRSLLAGRRMLIVLDNAGSADQVRPLLPGTPACTVVVTSRDALAGLVARDGATRLDLDVLPQLEAVAMLRTLIGARVDADPRAAAELAAQCCRLPLALRVAAELAVSHPAVPLAGLAGELADLRTRLDLLEAGGDPGTGVRAVFSWSYRHLSADAARAFRLLGPHPGPDFEPYAVAALTGETVQHARRALDVLAHAHLIQPVAPGRYGMHDLLRGYARELSATVDAEKEQHAALSRLFDHYLHTAATAMDTSYPAERHRRPRIPPPTTPVPPLTDPAAALDWLDRERAALVAAAGHTAARGWPSHATRLAATLFRYFHCGGHFPEGLTVLGHALEATRRTGDRVGEATTLNQIGILDSELGSFHQAADRHRQALALFRAAGDRAGEARALVNIGLDETRLGRYEEAVRHQQEALTTCRDLGDRFGEARALTNLGSARQLQGRYQEAAGYYQQSLDLSREIGDREGEAFGLARLGVVDLRLGRYQHAAGYLQHALTLFQEMGHSSSEAECLVRLGEVYLVLGRYEQAAGNLQQALIVFREIGDRVLEADALNGLGDVLLRTGDADEARAHHAAALRLAAEVGLPREQARAHNGLACAYQADGDPLQARHHWQEALTLYAAIGAPEADEIRARLAPAGDSLDDGDKPAEDTRV